MIRQDLPLEEHRDTPIAEAQQLGAVALFGEKYGDKVRVVRFGPSCEFCGGIHVKSTGHIGFFKIISESSVAAGVRRIEALTGKACEEAIYSMEDHYNTLRSLFNNAKDLESVVKKYIDEHEKMKKEIEQLNAQSVNRLKKDLIKSAEEINGVTVIRSIVPLSPEGAKDLVFQIRAAVPQKLVCVIGSTREDKPLLSAIFSDDMVKEHNLNAGKMIREAAKLIKGGGGGQAYYAQAGGKDANGLSAAVDKMIDLANL